MKYLVEFIDTQHEIPEYDRESIEKLIDVYFKNIEENKVIQNILLRRYNINYFKKLEEN